MAPVQRRAGAIFVPLNQLDMKIWLHPGLPILGLAGILFGFTGSREVAAPPADPPGHVGRTVTRTPARVRRGERIAQLLCLQCHADRENRLTGRRMTDVPKLFGKIYSANITQDKTVGIGGWSDVQLLFFLRTGQRRDGSLAPAMPRFPRMAEEDLLSVVAYLRSEAYPVQPDPHEAPRTRYSLPVKLLGKAFFKPLPYPEAVIAVPDSTDEVAFGRYLADDLIGCYGCHSADFKKLDPLHPERSKGYYGGGNALLGDGWETVRSANLTFDEETGLARHYTRETFIRAVKYGVRFDGTALRAPMTPHLALTDAEAGAIYECLKTVPNLHHAVRQHP